MGSEDGLVILCECYTRCVGYLRPRSTFNPGKAQEVSERRLRDLLSGTVNRTKDETPSYDDILLRSGASAALVLSDLPPANHPLVNTLTNAIAERHRDYTWDSLLTGLPAEYRQRWQELSQWLYTAEEWPDSPR